MARAAARSAVSAACPPGDRDRRDPTAGRLPAGQARLPRQQLECGGHLVVVGDEGDVEALEQCGVHLVPADEGAGVRGGGRGSGVGAPHLERHERLARAPQLRDRGDEGRNVLDRLEDETDGVRVRVLGEPTEVVLGRESDLAPGRDDLADRRALQRPRDEDRRRTGLADDGDVARPLDGQHALVGPQRYAVGEVQDPHAVRPVHHEVPGAHQRPQLGELGVRAIPTVGTTAERHPASASSTRAGTTARAGSDTKATSTPFSSSAIDETAGSPSTTSAVGWTTCTSPANPYRARLERSWLPLAARLADAPITATDWDASASRCLAARPRGDTPATSGRYV